VIDVLEKDTQQLKEEREKLFVIKESEEYKKRMKKVIERVPNQEALVYSSN